jgi:uncharacterized membrane protein YraQ (UPF0718 family)
MSIFEIILGIVIVLVFGFLIYKNKEKLKPALQKRIETNAIKIPNVTWTDRKGNEHTEDIVIKHSRLPLIGDWSRIHPPIDEEGKINWINTIFGGKKNFIILLIILAIVAIVLLAFYEIFSQYEALKEFCEPYLSRTN